MKGTLCTLIDFLYNIYRDEFLQIECVIIFYNHPPFPLPIYNKTFSLLCDVMESNNTT